MIVMKEIKTRWNQLLCWLSAYPKATFLIFEVFWITIFLCIYPYPMAPSETIDIAPKPLFALIVSTAIALLASIFLRPIVAKQYLWICKNETNDDSLHVVSFVLSYLAALFITYCLSFASVELFHIQDIVWLKTLLQVFLFLLSIVLFFAYRRDDKRQYCFYAAIYFFSTIAEWHRNWIVQCNPGIESTLDFIITFFVIPSKEAMLLFTIWDNRPRKRDCGSEQKQTTGKEHSVQRKPNTQKRRKKKNR